MPRARTPTLHYSITYNAIGTQKFGTDPPTDPSELISEYFGDVLEDYEITETPGATLLPESPSV